MKCHRTEDVAVVGHSHGRHVKFLDTPDQALDFAGAVEQGIVGMKMEMDELRLRHSEPESSLAASILCAPYDDGSLRKVWKTEQ